MNNITVIIPVHEWNDTVKKYLDIALLSLDKQDKYNKKTDVLIVSPITFSFEENYENLNIFLLVNTGKSDFQSQINFAVLKVKTKYFSVLEFDDEFSSTYFYNAEKYINNILDVDIFLTTMVEVVEKDGESVISKWTNETVWSQQFIGDNGEMGYLNMNSLKEYSDFKLSGAIIKTEEFINIGGYKSNIIMSFGYELLLRALNNSFKIFSIPKVLYKHLQNREGSMFVTYRKELSNQDRKFWFDVANKEFHYINDREIDCSILKNNIEK